MKNCRFPLVRPKYFGVIFFLACQPISTIHLFLATTTNSGEKAKKKNNNRSTLIVWNECAYRFNNITCVMCCEHHSYTYFTFHKMFCQHASQYRICVIGVVRGPIKCKHRSDRRLSKPLAHLRRATKKLRYFD